MNPEYRYRAKIIKAYDGDTVTAIVDLGMNTHRIEKLRLHGINAPEVRGDERKAGKASRDYLRKFILGRDVVIETTKDKKGKYGRYIAKIFVKSGDQMLNVSDTLVASGHAVYKEY